MAWPTFIKMTSCQHFWQVQDSRTCATGRSGGDSIPRPPSLWQERDVDGNSHICMPRLSILMTRHTCSALSPPSAHPHPHPSCDTYVMVLTIDATWWAVYSRLEGSAGPAPRSLKLWPMPDAWLHLVDN